MNHALKIAPDLPGAALGRQRLFNSAVPAWHFSMMNDEARNEAYQMAIDRAVNRSGLRVLDLGCGAGLLSMMAARAGAEHVTAVEATPLLAEMARNIVATNGFKDKIDVHAKWSLDLEVGEGKDMLERADVVVSEVVNSALIGEGMLKTYNDALQRLVKPGAVMIPEAGAVDAVLIESPEVERHTRMDTAAGFDMRAFNTFYPADYVQYDLRHTDYRTLSNKFRPLVFDFRQMHRSEKKIISLPFTRSGRAVAIAYWFILQLDSETQLSLAPEMGGRSSPHWRQAVQYLGGVAEVRAGDVLRLSVEHDMQNIHFRVVDITRP